MNSMIWLAGTRVQRPCSGKVKKVEPQGAIAYFHGLLEAVRCEIYKLKAYKLKRISKVVR